MSVLVIYKSAYGSTEQYAKWIAEEVNAEVVSVEYFNFADIEKYDTIVIGTYLRAGKMVMAKFIKDNWDKLSQKKVVLYSSSKTPVDSADAQKIYNNNIPENIRKHISYFPLEGKFVFDKLSSGDQTTMKIGQFMTRLFMGQKMAEEMIMDYDGMKIENIKPITAALAQ